MAKVARKNPSKSYVLQWFSLNEGTCLHLKNATTDNPRMMLFDMACSMNLIASTYLNMDTLKEPTIIKNIQNGHTAREHYWLEYPNGEVLSIMEQIRKEPANKD